MPCDDIVAHQGSAYPRLRTTGIIHSITTGHSFYFVLQLPLGADKLRILSHYSEIVISVQFRILQTLFNRTNIFSNLKLSKNCVILLCPQGLERTMWNTLTTWSWRKETLQKKPHLPQQGLQVYVEKMLFIMAFLYQTSLPPLPSSEATWSWGFCRISCFGNCCIRYHMQRLFNVGQSSHQLKFNGGLQLGLKINKKHVGIILAVRLRFGAGYQSF